MTKFIVDEKTMVDAIQFGLKQSIKDDDIIKRMMHYIIDELETVLWDDCEILEEKPKE